MIATELPRTPAPSRDESPAGYLIRLAELNGLGPVDLMSLLGNDQGRSPGVGWNYRDLQRLLGAMQCLPSDFGYRDPCSQERNQASLCGHQLWVRHLDVKCPRICPQCVKDLGYTPSAWDLRSYVACHVHGTLMLKHCVKCKERITNRRKGLLTCSCGADLGGMRTSAAPPGLVGIAEILWAVTYREPSVPLVARQLGFPVEDLMRCDLKVLCKIIVQIATLYSWSDSGVRTPRRDVAVVSLLPMVAQTLSIWPKHFHLLCKLWHTFCRRGKASSKVFQVGFRWLFVYLHKDLREVKGQTVFLLKSALAYGYQRWEEKNINVKEIAIRELPSVPRRYGSYIDAAKVLGLPPYSTVRWLLKGRLPARATGDKKSRPSWVVDLEKLKDIKLSKSSGLTERKAAKFLEISISMLRTLKKDGDIHRNFATSHAHTFAVEDLITFREDVLAGLREADPANARYSLKELISGAGAAVPAKVQVIRDMREGKLHGYVDEKRSLSGVYLSQDPGILVSTASGDDLMSLQEIKKKYQLNYYEARAIIIFLLGDYEGGPPPKVHINDVRAFFDTYMPLKRALVGTRLSIMTALSLLPLHLPGCQIFRLSSGFRPLRCPTDLHALFVRRDDRARIRRWVIQADRRLAAEAIPEFSTRSRPRRRTRASDALRRGKAFETRGKKSDDARSR